MILRQKERNTERREVNHPPTKRKKHGVIRFLLSSKQDFYVNYRLRLVLIHSYLQHFSFFIQTVLSFLLVPRIHSSSYASSNHSIILSSQIPAQLTTIFPRGYTKTSLPIRPSRDAFRYSNRTRTPILRKLGKYDILL